MRTQIRIVAGALRGRKIVCSVHPKLRPTPDMVREALFNILGNAVPDRPFFDVFAGTGVVGLEALSRGAKHVTFVERDFRICGDIAHHVQQFGVGERVSLTRMDVYRWSEHWLPPDEPVNVFLSPPFADFSYRPEEFLALVRQIQDKVCPDSVLAIQGERESLRRLDADLTSWDVRHYGRNELLIWVKEGN
jgi:16S rRNA (guanine(966)-N(2))-methyltransferase RsmD